MSLIDSKKTIRVGSRKSELALIQTKHVISELQKLFPDKQFEIHSMTTVGDRVLNKSLPKIGEKSLFTKDLENALFSGGVDFVVHSLKDLPTCLPTGLTIGAVLKREDPRDALVLNKSLRGKTLANLPPGSVIGTSSLRRTAQLARDYSHLVVCDIRGNLNTRLSKLDANNSKFSGIILAQAGLMRMNWKDRIDQILEPNELMYAVGQGALAVECRSSDEEILDMLFKLNDQDTLFTILTERSFLKKLGGGCSAPVAISTQLKRNLSENSLKYELNVKGAVWNLNGKKKIEETLNEIISLPTNKRQLNDNESNEESLPTKKIKLNKNDESDNDIVNNNLEEIDEVDRVGPSNLIIIDDDKANISDLDVEKLINVHGDVFKNCPHFEKHKKDNNELINNNSSGDGCPINIPIGQDFMGECPYIDIEQKIEVSGHFSQVLNKTDDNKIDKCPFKSVNDNLESNKCPFLSNVKLIDYDESKNQNTNKLIEDPDKQYCGLFKHKYIQTELYDKFEQCGIELANRLINHGALDVMAEAQKIIRGD